LDHAGTAIAVKTGTEKTEFAELRDQVARERCLPRLLLFNNGDDFVFDELARGLAVLTFLRR